MNRSILITGGSGQFGHSLIHHFLARGDRIAFSSRSAASRDAVLTEYPDAGQRLIGIVADFNNDGSAEALRDQLLHYGFHATDLVNNARSQETLKLRADGAVARSQFIGEFLIDVVAPYELTMALATYAGSKLRRVVNIGSQYGSVAVNPTLYDNPALQSPLHYSVAKAALAHLTRELAVRLADRNIRVNCIAFGGVEGRVSEAFQQRYAALNPLGRMLREDEVAGPVDFLLSAAAGAMNGHVMAVDGGWTIW